MKTCARVDLPGYQMMSRRLVNGLGVWRRPQKYQETWRVVPGVRTSRLLYARFNMLNVSACGLSVFKHKNISTPVDTN